MVRFSCNVLKEELKEVNISSLLFFSGTNICTLQIGNINADLIVNGEIRIIKEDTGEVYKNFGAFTKEIKDIIRSGKALEENGYYVDMNNWFELFVTDEDDNDLGYEVADIEGELDENNLIGSLFKFMVNMVQDFVDKEDFDYMSLSGNEVLLTEKTIKNAFEDYKSLALAKENKADEEIGRQLYMNSNERLCWVSYLDEEDKMKDMLIEI